MILTYQESLALGLSPLGPYVMNGNFYVVPERKLSFSPISASDENSNPRNTQCVPVVKIFVFLDLNKKSWFSFRHYVD